MQTNQIGRLPITVLMPVFNEEINLTRSLPSLSFAERIVVIDSGSTDDTIKLCNSFNAEVVEFNYFGGYPKKRQWALENINITTPWVLLLDADEVVPVELWEEIQRKINSKFNVDAFLITKGFHFLGRPLRFGGFSHSAVLLFKNGKARFERIFDDNAEGLPMEIHERVLVDGLIGRISTPLIHEDFKGLEAYIARHNKYSTWEAQLRYRYLITNKYGEETISPKWFGNSQERRRAIKSLIIRIPGEQWLWFFYHYVVRFAFLEGRIGLIACQIRASYIAQVRAKLFELSIKNKKISNTFTNKS